MIEYHKLLKQVLDNGVYKMDRTGTGTISVFGTQNRYNLQNGFPVVTTKQLHIKSVIHELLWFLKGDTNSRSLEKNGVTIWKEWADEDGDLGPIYGKQWTSWEPGIVKEGTGFEKIPVNQISKVIESIKNDPHSRRHIVSAWNVSEIPDMALPPCHVMFQFYVDDENRLSLQVYQRSCDIFLGAPFNITSYALLLSMVAQVTGLKPYEFIHTIGDAHLYINHIEQAKLQLSRDPLELPSLELNPNIKDIFDFKYEDFKLINYNHYPKIAAEIAV